jgi:hypothetical protein
MALALRIYTWQDSSSQCPQTPSTYNIEWNRDQILLKVSKPSAFHFDCSAPAVSRFFTACLTVGSFIILNYTIQWTQRRRELSAWETEGRVLCLALKRVRPLFFHQQHRKYKLTGLGRKLCIQLRYPHIYSKTYFFRNKKTMIIIL